MMLIIILIANKALPMCVGAELVLRLTKFEKVFIVVCEYMTSL